MYLLDTNIVSRIMKSDPIVQNHLRQVPRDKVLISVISYAELCFGLAKNPAAVRQRAALNSILKYIPIAPFDEQVAQYYGDFKARMQQTGKNLTPLDLAIAAHAESLGAILVSNDQAFFKLDGFAVADWTK